MSKFKKTHNFLISPYQVNQRITSLDDLILNDEQNNKDLELKKSSTSKSAWSQLAQPHEFTDLNTITPRTVQITDQTLQCEINSNKTSINYQPQEEEALLQSLNSGKKNRFNRQRFLQAMKASCKKFSIEVQARQQFQRQLGIADKTCKNYNRNRTPSVTHTFINSANSNNLFLNSLIESTTDNRISSPKDFSKRKNSNTREQYLDPIDDKFQTQRCCLSPNISMTSHPSTRNSSQQNTPNKSKKHIKTLAPTSSMPKLKKLQNSPSNSTFIPEIDLRENVQRVKTQGDCEQQGKQIDFQSKDFRIFLSPKNQKKLLPSSSTSFLNHKKSTSYAQINSNKVKPPTGKKDIRSIKNLGKANKNLCYNKSHSLCSKSLSRTKSSKSNNNNITTIYLTQDSKQQQRTTEISSQQLYQKMKDKYLTNMKIRDKEKEQKNYIQRNILCLKKQEGGQKRIMKCNH